MNEVKNILNRLRNAGVRITASQGKLSIIAPRGAITVETRDQLVRYKAQLLAIVEAVSGVNDDAAREPIVTPNDSGNQPPAGDAAHGDLANEVTDDCDLPDQPPIPAEAQARGIAVELDSQLVEHKAKPRLQGQPEEDSIANSARRRIGELLAIAFRRFLSARWAGCDQVEDIGVVPLANSYTQIGHGDVP